MLESLRRNSDGFTGLALAKYLYNKGEIEAALDHLNQAVTAVPSLLDGRKLMGEILLNEGRNEEGLKAYRDFLPTLDLPYWCFSVVIVGINQTNFPST